MFSIVNSFTPNTTIASSPMNANFTDIASGLTDCLTRDGQAPMTAALLLINGSTSVPSIAFAADPTNGLYRYASGVLGVTGDLEVDGTVKQAGNPLVPAGVIVDFAGSTAPAGWLLCYAQAVSRTTYADLFAAIGTTYGGGDGTTTFNLPDARGRNRAGLDNMGGSSAGRLSAAMSSTTLGATGGASQATLVTNNLPPYTPIGSLTNTSTMQVGIGITSTGLAVGAGGTLIPIGAPLTTYGLGTQNSLFPINPGSISWAGNAQGGTSVPFNTIPPTMVMNTIIKY